MVSTGRDGRRTIVGPHPAPPHPHTSDFATCARIFAARRGPAPATDTYNERMRIGLIAVLLLRAAGAAWAAGEQTLEDVERQLVERAGRLRSVQYRLRESAQRKGELGLTHTHTEGVVEVQRDGDLVRFRIEIENETTATVEGRQQQIQNAIESVCDGRFVSTLQDQGGVRRAFRSPYTPQMNPLDPANVFAGLRRNFDLRLVGEGQAGEQPAWIIDATLRLPDVEPIVKRRLYLARDTGIVLRTVGYDAADEPVMESNVTGLRIDAPIPAERFVFRPPPGIEVIDLPAPAPASASQPSTRPGP